MTRDYLEDIAGTDLVSDPRVERALDTLAWTLVQARHEQ